MISRSPAPLRGSTFSRRLCLPYVKVGGCFVAMKGQLADVELDEAKRGIRLLGGRVERVYEYEVEDAIHRAVVIRKEAPRRPDIPAPLPKSKRRPYKKWNRPSELTSDERFLSLSGESGRRSRFRAAPHNSASGFGERFFVKARFGKRRNTLCTREGHARIRMAPLSPTAATYFSLFKPQNWRKRSGEACRRNCAVLPYFCRSSARRYLPRGF